MKTRACAGIYSGDSRSIAARDTAKQQLLQSFHEFAEILHGRWRNSITAASTRGQCCQGLRRAADARG